MIKFLDLTAQYKTIKKEIDLAISNVINEAAFIGGKYVAEFERQYAEYIGVNFCVGVANGTDALEIAIESLNLPPGSEIIVPGNSFIASSEAITRSGYKVVFADVDERSYTLTADSILNKITPLTKAVIAVHLYGHPCDMDSILEVCKSNELFLIEDCAQAHGAKYKNKNVGTFGVISTFSFYPGKNLGAYGDAGAICTNHSNFASRIRMIANHGRIAKYDHQFEGRNSRLDGLQAAILSVKLTHLNQWTEHRIAIANYYYANLASISGIILPEKKSWAHHVYHLFVIRCKERDELKDYLYKKGIETGIHYPISLPQLKAYEYLKSNDMNAFYYKSSGHLLSIPIGDQLSIEQISQVTKSIKDFYSN